MRWFFWGFGASLPIGAAIWFHNRWWAHSDVLDHFGSFLAGYAALLAVVFAAVKGSQEWDDWKRRHRHEKHSEVAGQIIVAARKLADALKYISAAQVFNTDPTREENESEYQHLRKVIDHRFAQYKDEISEYHRACWLAEAYMPDSELVHVRKGWDLVMEMHKGWETFARGRGMGENDVAHMAIRGQQRVEDARSRVEPTVDALCRALRTHTIGATNPSDG